MVVALVVLATAGVSACGSGAEPPAAQRADDCIVRLHGKGGKGSSTTVSNSVADLNPSGNAAGWGGRQWLYFPQEEYDAARAIVTAAVDTSDCKRVVIDGFSNGASFAASLLCHNETLDGRLVGVVIDDPVTDASTEKCARSASVKVASTGPERSTRKLRQARRARRSIGPAKAAQSWASRPMRAVSRSPFSAAPPVPMSGFWMHPSSKTGFVLSCPVELGLQRRRALPERPP